jgi:hypothetical protein
MDFIFKFASIIFYSSPKDLVSKREIKPIVIEHENENEYKIKHPFEKRFYEIEKIKDLHPGKIPVYTLADGNFKIKKVKYLVFDDLKLYQFMNVVKKNIQYNNKAGDYYKELYISLDGKKSILDMNITFDTLYNQHKDRDGFLYLVISLMTNYSNKPTIEEYDNIDIEVNNQDDCVELFEMKK